MGGTLDFDETKLWTDFLDANHISSANWAVSDKRESCSALQADAATTGGWTPSADADLTWSGLYVRNYISKSSDVITCDGEGWPCVAPDCADDNEECLATKCCGSDGYSCYAKDDWWAQCMTDCGGDGQD